MKTPTKFTHNQLKKIINNSKCKLFHHTRLDNLASILGKKAIYSIGTLWGLESTIRTNPAFNGSKNKYEDTAKQGFIDFIFLSNFNRIENGTLVKPIYGHVALEFELDILLNREHFFFPFNTGFDWDSRGWNTKFSDLSTLHNILNSPSPTNEVLIRREIPLAGKLKRIHAFNDSKAKVEEIVNKNKDDIFLETCYYDKGGASMSELNLIPCKEGVIVYNSKKYSKDKLFQMKDNNESIFVFDEETNCFSKFLIIGNEIYFEEDKTKPVGKFSKN